ncbi:MAG: hypothetical protein IPI65_08395 [Bacteroidetes bacterium]|nr:hypothetical protein [Bacteroidota bacterium]
MRSEGGLYMQMNYGPDEAMKTAIAGYTPNVMWFHRLVNKAAGIHTYYVQSGEAHRVQRLRLLQQLHYIFNIIKRIKQVYRSQCLEKS